MGDGGELDCVWFKRWKNVGSLKCRQYDIPRGSVGSEFIGLVNEELVKLNSGETRSERLYFKEMEW